MQSLLKPLSSALASSIADPCASSAAARLSVTSNLTINSQAWGIQQTWPAWPVLLLLLCGLFARELTVASLRG